MTAEDAYAYSKFARVALGTNDIDFRARPHSAEEADFLAAEVVLAAPTVLLHRPRDAPRPSCSPASSPRTRPARSSCGCARPSRGRLRTRVVALAPYASRGLRKMDGHARADRARVTRPPRSPALLEHAEYGIDKHAVVLVGERLATVPGALSAAADLAAQDRCPAGLGAAPGR